MAGVALGALLLASACTMNETSAPDIAGPSELGLSINLAANPDILTMDGYGTSEIVVTARNSTGGPANGIGIRAEIVYQGQIQDVGRLSSKTATTGSDGRAVLAYTAPSSSQGLNVDGGNAIVTIRVIPVGSDYSAAVERSVNIRLVPQGITGPRPGTPIAKFRFAPTSPKEGEEIRFDGSLSRDCAPDQSAADCLAQQGPSPTLVRYFWQWGDGDDARAHRASPSCRIPRRSGDGKIHRALALPRSPSRRYLEHRGTPVLGVAPWAGVVRCASS